MTVGAVLLRILRDPAEYLLRRWNWKSAVFSPVIRAVIFFFANLTAGWRPAALAALVELLYRGPTAGVYGALTQAFRRCDPPWAAGLTVMLLLPLLSHSLEAIVHYLRGTPNLVTSILCSAAFTALSTLFNLFAMRRGLLITDGEDARSIWSDLRRVPVTIALFIASGPKWLWILATARIRPRTALSSTRFANHRAQLQNCDRQGAGRSVSRYRRIGAGSVSDLVRHNRINQELI